MAARTRKVYQDSNTIERIRGAIETGQLVKSLTEHVNGTKELSATQVRAAEILLRKTIPDLSAVEHSGEVETNYVAHTPAPSQSMDVWQTQFGTPPTTVQ